MLFREISQAEWPALRSKYAYPAVRLIRSRTQAGFEVDDSRRQVATDFELEKYHQSLLMSDDAEERRLGAASVTYWGFYGSATSTRRPTPERALSRAQNVYFGSRRHARINDVCVSFLREELHIKLESAKLSIKAGDMAGGFTAYLELFDVGPSFATKLVAFANPLSAAVLDRVVCRRLTLLADRDLSEIGQRFIVTKSKLELTRLYAKWCDLCAVKARALNSSGSAWPDASGALQPWRAIDVERTVFAWSDAQQPV